MSNIFLNFFSSQRKNKSNTDNEIHHFKGAESWGYCCFNCAGLAQSLERLTAEREVAGSIPGAGLILRVLK